MGTESENADQKSEPGPSGVDSASAAEEGTPDLQSGLRIISRLPLNNPQLAESELDRLLDNLLQNPPPASVYLNLLEQMRMPLHLVEEERARHYVHKPLPLGDDEESCFQQVIATWSKVARTYAHCLKLDTSPDSIEHTFRDAQILHRCLHYAGLVIVEHQRARRELPHGVWLGLHAYFTQAEKKGVATLSIPDSLDPLGRSTHCTAAYVSLLLSEQASPYSLSIRDQTLVRRWASNWAPLVSLHAVVPGEPLPAYVVDLTQDVGLCASSDSLQTEQVRRLDTSHLSLQLGQIRQQLNQKMAPSQTGLGEDCTAGQCKRLLAHLSTPWSQARAPRKFRRHATTGIAKVCLGFDEMHYYISGREFSQQDHDYTYSRQAFENLFAFPLMDDPAQQLQMRQQQLGFTVDQWEVVNQSATGFRLMRRIVGKKIAHGQLLAICPHDGVNFLLAHVTWLMQEQGGGLIAGIAALPGIPQAVAARPIGQDATHNELYRRAFILPAVPTIGAEQSLVIPQGWYRAGRLFEIFSDAARRVKLLHVLDDGPDFERVSFVEATST